MEYSITTLVLSGLGVTALALAVGFAVGSRGRAWLSTQIDQVKDELARAASQVREQGRTLAKLRNEQRAVASLARFLPSFVRELNRSDLDYRQVPTLIVQLAAAIFEADQVFLYLARSPGDENDHSRELFLKAKQGSLLVPEMAARISFGEGRIGWVAENKVDMAAEDWKNLSLTDGQSIRHDDSFLRLDLVGPLVHHASHGEERVLGVLCVGGLGAHPREEKLMLQMICNLGSIALMSARNVSQLRDLANHDGLTGLLNKRQFMHNLGLMINAAARAAQPVGIFIFDIDYFKRYNDSHGHMTGDELLKTIPRVVRKNLRAGDIAGRYGGEEFVIAMPDTDRDAAYEVAEKVRGAIEAHDFPHGESQPGGRLTISGGVACFPHDGTSGIELIGHADEALYEAKASGRNRVMRYRGVHIGDTSGEYHEDLGFPGSNTAMEG